MPHGTRPKIDPRYPVQVTIRAAPGLPSLRSARVFGALRRAIGRAKAAATLCPATWMAAIGWRLASGPLRVEEHPAAAPRPRPT